MDKRQFNPAVLFRNNMVLQRDKPLKVWGSGPEGGRVKVEIQGFCKETAVCDGRWELSLPPLNTSVNETMLLSCRADIIELVNICVGEVWIAGGQSNMEFYMKYDTGREQVLKDEENRLIRFFDYPEVSYSDELEEYDFHDYGLWRTCDYANLDYFSAVGYYFARKLEKDLDVPIGIVGCNWGGTPACAWIDPEYLESNAGKAWLSDYEKAVIGLDYDAYINRFLDNPANIRNNILGNSIESKLMNGMDPEQIKIFMESPDYSDAPPEPGPRDPNRPGGLYETMLKKIAPFAARGVIWYQGESDDRHPEIYDSVFSSLIKCWRDLWDEELPFLFVQLAPFRQWLHCSGETYPVLRQKQDIVSRNVNNVWMASIMDSGMEFDIHPKRKEPVGERLALLAEGKVYSFDILCEPPEFVAVEVRKRRAILYFKNTGKGLQLKGRTINALELYIDSRAVDNYKAKISGDRIILKSKIICPGSCIEIRFAYCDYCEVNIYNSAGLSAKPFIYAEG